MNLSQLPDLVADILLSPCRLTPHLKGAPGIGKTDAGDAISAVMTDRTGQPYPVLPWLLSNADHTDVGGIPIPFKDAEGRAITALTLSPILSAIEATGSPTGILLLDEYMQASDLVRKVAANFKLTRRLGDASIPEGWHIICASNRQSDKSGTGRQLMHDQSRDWDIPIDTDRLSWLTWAADPTHGIPPAWQGFGEKYFAEIHVDAVPATPGPFPTPRGCSEVFRALGTYQAEIPAYMWASIAGAIGEGTAATMRAYHRGLARLPSWADCVADPMGVPIPPPSETDQRWALAHRTAHDAETTTLDQATQLVGRLPIDLQDLFRRAVYRRPGMAVRCAVHPWFIQWAKDHPDRV